MKLTKHEVKVLRALLHEACLLRDGSKCLKCDKTTALATSHIYPKGTYRSMEYDLDNVKILCVRCHIFWWHKNPMEAHEWLEATIPAERLDRLKLRSQVIDKKIIDYNLLRLYLENEIKVLNESQ